MRRSIVSFIAVALLLAMSAVMGQGPFPVLAQESTPAAGPIAAMELAPGVTAEVFAGAPSARKRDGKSGGNCTPGCSSRARWISTSSVSGMSGLGMQTSTGQTAAHASWS